MATTIEIPLSPLMLNMADSNCYFSAIDGTNYDSAAWIFRDAVTGTMYWYGYIPANVAATPAWNLKLYHYKDTAGAANVVLTITAKDFANSDAWDAALTSLHSAAAFAVDSTSGDLTITTLSGTNYDATEAVAASNLLVVGVSRIGGNGSDTLNTSWYLQGVSLRIDLT